MPDATRRDGKRRGEEGGRLCRQDAGRCSLTLASCAHHAPLHASAACLWTEICGTAPKKFQPSLISLRSRPSLKTLPLLGALASTITNTVEWDLPGSLTNKG